MKGVENGGDVAWGWGGQEEIASTPPRRPPRQRPRVLQGADRAAGSDELYGQDRSDGPPEAGAKARLPPSIFKVLLFFTSFRKKLKPYRSNDIELV